MTKDERQLEIHNIILEHNVRAYFEGCTGFGKTRVAINLIKEALSRNPDRIIHVVVPSKPLALAWTKKKTGHIDKYKLKNVFVYIVNTYVKEPRICDLLIADEAHRYSNDSATLFRKVIGETQYKFVLALSATFEGHHKSFLESRGIKSAGIVTLEEAKREGWVADYEIINIGLDLTDEDRKAYKKMHEGFNSNFAYFNHDFDIAMKCMTNREFRESFARDLDNITAERLFIHALNWRRNMEGRKTFLYNNIAKQEACKKIIQSFKDKHIMCFSESADFATKLQYSLGDVSVTYHSKNKPKQNRENMAKFIDMRTRVYAMIAVKALDEGVDIPSIDLGIIASRTSKQLQNTQRVGRTLRIVKDKKSFIINLYIKESQDEVWLKKSIKGLRCLWMEDIDSAISYINE
jgi:superfamily II DNA or RNA helicase